jgi:hypothetical protein
MRLLIAAAFTVCAALAQRAGFNFDESKVAKYTLPNPLVLANGQPVRNAQTWYRLRRPEILHLFETQIYGRTPDLHVRPLVEALGTDPKALGGKAVRKQFRVWLTGKKSGPKMDVLLYLPAGAKKPSPVFVGLNFGGNHTVHADPGIALPEVWVRNKIELNRSTRQRATAAQRGANASSWQVEKIVEHGFGLATACYQDIEPDFVGGIAYSIRALPLTGGQTDPAADEWGALGAWAWGLSRIVDTLHAEREVDSKRIAVIGHSRLGKTALWAAAQDTRIALVVSNNSGEGGAALSRRNFGETVAQLNRAFPHWFCRNYRQYSDDPNTLPVDMHELLALIAPRPAYVASAEQDQWADPRGEFLSAVAAGPVYELLGKQGLGTTGMPGIEQPIMHGLGYHIRAGKHEVTAYDWDQYLKFAERHFTGGAVAAPR